MQGMLLRLAATYNNHLWYMNGMQCWWKSNTSILVPAVKVQWVIHTTQQIYGGQQIYNIQTNIQQSANMQQVITTMHRDGQERRTEMELRQLVHLEAQEERRRKVWPTAA